MSGQAGRYQRSSAGLVGAMIVLLGVIAAVWLFTSITRTEPKSPVETVDHVETASYAKDASVLDVVAPGRLPEGWRATSATFTPEPSERWHLGVLTDDDKYVGLEQADRRVEDMVETYVAEDASRGPELTVRGPQGSAAWTLWTDDKGDTALTHRSGSTTTLVVGTVSQDVLVDYVESLR